mmetsp:Transcript_2110/g.6841  ORF Transcript_2110/g.6841 Transcript_2110/m.6841 type:complete len:222 (-) Transcript_2110:1030-1695(-)
MQRQARGVELRRRPRSAAAVRKRALVAGLPRVRDGRKKIQPRDPPEGVVLQDAPLPRHRRHLRGGGRDGRGAAESRLRVEPPGDDVHRGTVRRRDVRPGRGRELRPRGRARVVGRTRRRGNERVDRRANGIEVVSAWRRRYLGREQSRAASRARERDRACSRGVVLRGHETTRGGRERIRRREDGSALSTRAVGFVDDSPPCRGEIVNKRLGSYDTSEHAR